MIKRLVSSIALVAASPALAETAAAPSDTGGADIIVVASRVTTEAREIGSAITVITQTDIRRNQAVFVKDVLQDAPGLLLSTNRAGDASSVYIRGSNNDEVLWLVDGIELGDPSAISTQFQSEHLTARDIARVEILRGNQSSLYGADAIGGVINIVTQRATEEGFTVNAEAEGGSYGTISGGASVLGKSGPLDFRLTATGYRQGGPSLSDPRTATPPGSITEDDEYWRYGLSGRVGVQATDTLSFQTIGYWLDSKSDFDSTTSDSPDFVKKKEYAVAGQGLYADTEGRFSAKLTASRYNARRLYFGPFNGADGDLYDGTKDELSLDLAYKDIGPVSLAAGANYERQKTTQSTFFSGDFFFKMSTKSVYGEVALKPAEGLTLTGAVRHDDNSRFGTFDTYRGTFAYALGQFKLRGSYGTGARAPGLYQLFDPTFGNPDLKAEKARGGDVGVDVTLGDKISAQLTYFVTRKRNEINFDGSRPPFGGYAQFGRTRADGVELALNAELLSWLKLNQSFTYISHKVDTAGSFVASGRPKYNGTTSVTLTPIEQASFTARARYRDGDSSGFGGTTKDYVTVDLLGSYAITDQIELYGRVVNLFDRHYQMVYGTNTLGLSLYGGVRVSF